MEKVTFEEKEAVVDTEIRKRRGKWFLGSVIYIDFDDVSQIIKAHIYKKWHLWDQSKALEPWLNRVISNQIKNLIRNNYGVFAKPCINCPFNEERFNQENGCSFTKSGTQSKECPLYAKWAKGKKHEHSIKMATSYDTHEFEIKSIEGDSVNIEKGVENMHLAMKKRLSERQYMAYKLLYIENLTDEQVAIKLGFKTSEKNRTAGYRQIKNLKNTFQNLAKVIVEEEDIFYV